MAKIYNIQKTELTSSIHWTIKNPVLKYCGKMMHSALTYLLHLHRLRMYANKSQ